MVTQAKEIEKLKSQEKKQEKELKSVEARLEELEQEVALLSSWASHLSPCWKDVPSPNTTTEQTQET